MAVSPIARRGGRKLITEPLLVATNYRGQLVFMTEGRGDSIPSGISITNPEAPYNSTGTLQPPLLDPYSSHLPQSSSTTFSAGNSTASTTWRTIDQRETYSSRT
jgi:hypothetical protein